MVKEEMVLTWYKVLELARLASIDTAMNLLYCGLKLAFSIFSDDWVWLQAIIIFLLKEEIMIDKLVLWFYFKIWMINCFYGEKMVTRWPWLNYKCALIDLVTMGCSVWYYTLNGIIIWYEKHFCSCPTVTLFYSQLHPILANHQHTIL